LDRVLGSGKDQKQQVLDAFELMESQKDNPEILTINLSMATLVGKGMLGAGKGMLGGAKKTGDENIKLIETAEAI
jgi:hypothetical protein